MINKLKEQMTNMKLLGLNIVIVILAVVLVITAGIVVQEYVDAFSSYQNKENSFIYAMESENYGRIVSMYYENCRNGYGEKKSLQEYYGVAKYYEAAFLYNMYTEVGDTAHAEIQRAAMEEAALQMGDFAFLTEDIHEKLGLSNL